MAPRESLPGDPWPDIPQAPAAASWSDVADGVHALRIERVEVGPTQLEALVRANPILGSTARVDGVATRAIELLPGLVRHTCKNGSAHGMAAELADTETAHLLEHVTLELMALSGSPRDLRADTRWDFSADGADVYRVRIGYDVDLVALGALRAGVEVVDWLMGAVQERPDIDGVVSELARVRAG